MTLICAHKNDQTSFIISDIRVSFRNKTEQNDKLIKFLSFNNEFGLFIAGDVSFWAGANKEVQKIITKITFSNFLDNNEPFWQCLTFEAINYHGERSGAIGFFLGPDCHKMFKVSITPEVGATIEELEDNKFTILGSATEIPDLEKILAKTYDNVSKDSDRSTFSVASFIRQVIIDKLKSLGSTSFKKLGISPIMLISILERGHFEMIGEEIEVATFTKHTSYEGQYQILKNSSGEIFYTNSGDCTSERLITLNDSHLINGDDVFDPAGVTAEFDPSTYFDTDYVFLFEQNTPLITPNDGLIPVKRIIYRIDFHTAHRFLNDKQLIFSHKQSINQIDCFGDPPYSKIIFSLNPEDTVKFLTNLNDNNLFNLTWLKNNILLSNYKIISD